MNQRPLQFRQWNDKKQEFHYWGFGPWENMSHWVGPKNNSIYYGPSEQFTGLYDKNGEKIWEGDIVTIHIPDGGFWKVTLTKIALVRFEVEQGGFIVEWEYSKNQHHENLTCDVAILGKVIGNVHQNPDLIK